MSDRRLAILGSLGALSLFVVAMVGVRVLYTGSPHYGGLIWNLILAWVPFALALAIYDGYRRGAQPRRLVAGGALGLVFFPNAPYLMTDFKHLRGFTEMPIWYDVVLLTAAAWAGLLLGFTSLWLMQAVARRLVGSANAWLFAFAVLALSSFGIYLGRFQRWNSWDVFVQPRSLLADVGGRLAHPADHPRTVAVTVLFTSFLATTYLVFDAFARVGLAERVDRPSP